jgi:hypothetical protein
MIHPMIHPRREKKTLTIPILLQDTDTKSRVNAAKASLYPTKTPADWWAGGCNAHGLRYSEASQGAAPLARGVLNVHCSELSPAKFMADHAGESRPILLRGLMEEWPAMQRWQTGALYQSHGESWVPVGDDDAGGEVSLLVRDFLDYMVGYVKPI